MTTDDVSKAENGDISTSVERRMHVISRTVVTVRRTARNAVSCTLDFGRGGVLTCTANIRSASSRSDRVADEVLIVWTPHEI